LDVRQRAIYRRLAGSGVYHPHEGYAGVKVFADLLQDEALTVFRRQDLDGEIRRQWNESVGDALILEPAFGQKTDVR